ncbi:MAG TPA: thermostable hemolysin [Stellaceae bacterium]|jgi:Thermostable hemolysin|nr:thermostable hemolysin [Stellaceae bacterium]
MLSNRRALLSGCRAPEEARAGARFAEIEPIGDAQTGRHLIVVAPSHALRARVEACIRTVYEQAFGVCNPLLADTLVALVDEQDQPLCAAGLRTAVDGFFSESYLDGPIEDVLTDRTGRPVPRRAIFEVSTLAGRSTDISPEFLRRIAALGMCAGFLWSFFTATAHLRKLLRRLGMPVLELAPAELERVPDPARWGTYYAHSPRVCAVGAPWPADEPAWQGSL